MKVLALKRSPEKTSKEAKSYVDEILTSKEPENFDYLFSKSDFVLNICPLTEETTDLFDFEKFKKMKKSSIFMNIGRGKSVKEEDLIRAIKEEEIAGAYLDVFYEEPLSKESELWGFDNVYMTPHCADWTDDIFLNSINIFVKNFEIYVDEGVIGFDEFKVDKELGY